MAAALEGVRYRRGRPASDYRSALTRGTTPTLFVCDLRWAGLREGAREQIAATLLGGVVATLGVPDAALAAKGAGPLRTWDGYRVPAIAPAHIVGHTHPERVRDPHRGGLYAWREDPWRAPAARHR